MLIREWMSRSVVTIDHNRSLNDAIDLFNTRVISMLPVMEKKRMVGIITDGDIKKAAPSDATTLDKFEMPELMDSIKIKTIMSKPVITIREEYTVGEAAVILLKKGISGMPVLDDSGSVIGIITKSDIFRCIVSFTGVSRTGQIFAFKLPDEPGAIKIITDIIRKTNGRLSSIMTSYDGMEKGFRKVFFHTFGVDPFNFDFLIEKFQGAGELIYVADLTKGFRKIF